MNSSIVCKVEIFCTFYDESLVFSTECFIEKIHELGSLLWIVDNFMLCYFENFDIGDQFSSLEELCIEFAFSVELNNIECVD
jgi:hypothetical protein